MFSAVSRAAPSAGDLAWKMNTRLATIAALPACTRTGNVITASANGLLTIDGVGTVAGYRVLIKDQAVQADNGIYDVTAAGDATHPFILTRSGDSNTGLLVQAGSINWNTAGTVNNKTFWVQTNTGTVTIIPAINSDGLNYAILTDTLTTNGPIVHVYAASTTYVLPGNVKFVIVEVVGGGGQGGGSAANVAGNASQGGGGGGGGYARKLLLATGVMSGNYTVTVGAGGSTGGAGAVGQAGGLSSFAGAGITTVQGNGGNGGGLGGTSAVAAVSAAGGAGATGTGGDVNISGGHGLPGNVIAALALPMAAGGGSALGSPAAPPSSSNAGGNAPDGGFGGGGSGATGSSGAVARAGGAGGAGLVIVTEFHGP